MQEMSLSGAHHPLVRLVVLWFERDVYNQLISPRVLADLSQHRPGRIELVLQLVEAETSMAGQVLPDRSPFACSWGRGL